MSFTPGKRIPQPLGARASSTAWAQLKAKLLLTSGVVVCRYDSNGSPFSGADNTTFQNTMALQMERTVIGCGAFATNSGPNNVTVIPFVPDTAATNLTDAPNSDTTQLRTYGGMKVIGPESAENYIVGSPFQGWIQPRTPGADNATAGAGYCMEVRINVRAGDGSARIFSRNVTKFAICYELRRSGTISIAAGNQPGYDDSNVSIGGGVTYGSNVNQSESFNLLGQTTPNTSFGADPSGIYFNGGNVDCAFTGGGQDHVGPVWTQYFNGTNPGNKDFVIQIRVPTNSALRLFGIALATDNAKGQNRSNVEVTTPRWSFWNFARSGACARHYSPTYDASGGSVSAAQLFRRWFGAIVNLFGTPLVTGSPLSGATSVPVLLACGVDIIIDVNGVNDFISQASTVANIKAYHKNIANAAAALGIVYVKVMPICPSAGAANATLKNASAVNWALVQTAMRELVEECPNFVLCDTWEAIGNPLPTDQFWSFKLHPGFIIANANNYAFDGMHFTQVWRDMACQLVAQTFLHAKTK